MIPVIEAYQVHQEVNSYIEYVADTTDVWQDNLPKQGDCDDYALSKRKILLDKGYSPSDIRVMSVVANGAIIPDHLVLAVNTERGWYVFDSMHPYFYKYVTASSILVKGSWYAARSSDGEPSKWQQKYPNKAWIEFCINKKVKNETDYDCELASFK